MSNVTGGGEGGGDSHIKEIGGHTVKLSAAMFLYR